MYCKTYSHIFEAKVIRMLCHNEHNVSLSFMKKEISVGEPIIIHSVRVYKSFIFIYERVGENRRGNQEWTIQRNWQHWVQKTQDEDKQSTD